MSKVLSMKTSLLLYHMQTIHKFNICDKIHKESIISHALYAIQGTLLRVVIEKE